MALKKPVAQVDGEVYLIVLWNVKDVFLVLHVYRHKFVAYLWSMLGVVNQTKFFVLNVQLQLWIVVESDSLAFDLLAPSILIEALSEEDNVSHHSLIVILVDPVAHAIQVQCKDFVDQHFLSILVSKVVVIALPSLGVGILRKSLSLRRVHAWNVVLLGRGSNSVSRGVFCGL